LAASEEAWIAAVNGPASTVVAGTPDAMAATIAACEGEGVRARAIPVDYASHTPHVERVRTALLELAGPITPVAGNVPMYSTVTAGLIDTAGLDAEYWYRNLRERVRFQEVADTLIEEGDVIFLEVSPHPVLSAALGEAAHARDAETAVVGTLRRDTSGPARFVTSMAELWAHGVAVDWDRVLPGRGHVELPTYAFQRDRYWLAPVRRATGTARDAAFWDLVERGSLSELATTLQIGEQAGLPEVLPALSAWHRARAERSTVDSLRYRVDWKPLPHLASGSLTGTWLVVGDEDADHARLAQVVAAGLRARGVKVTGDSETPDIAGVVSVGGVGATLGALQSGFAAPVWCVTQGAVTAGGQPVSAPGQARVWGLGRVAAQELPGTWGGLVDLPAEVDDLTFERLCATLAGATEDQVAIRTSGVFGRRLVRAPLGDRGDRWAPSRGTVLITGGTGAVGAHLARKLAALGAEHLLLASRRGDGAPGAAGLRDELVAAGAEVTIVACDVADSDELGDLVAGYPLTAVVHAAAVLDDAPVSALTPERVAEVLRVKAGAAWRLHELTEHLDLEAFVLVSSIAGTVGMAGQGNYAPGNAYLDALAEYRRARGLAATSIAWGTWADGMADNEEVTATRRRHGLPPMTPDQATSALEAALAHGDTTIVVADVDWSRFAHAYTAARPSPLLDELPEAAVGTTAPEPGGSLRDRLTGLSARERDRELRDTIRVQLAAVLGYDPAEPIGARRRFPDLGMDSVTAVELCNRLGAATTLRLPPTAVFDHPTVAELADHLGSRLFDAAEREPGAAELDALDRVLTDLPDGAPVRARIADRLRHLLRTAVPDQLDTASDDEIFGFIEQEFGIS
ncbi:SDR family NAD(P)-dependent oxidoreductase, partial [Amycolatopsis lurida]